MQETHKKLATISTILFFWSLGCGAVWFILPQIAGELTGDLVYVGLLIALPALIGFIASMPLGGLTDKLGRKTMLQYGIASMVFIVLALNMLSSIHGFILFLLLFGAIQQLLYIPSAAYLMDIAPRDKRSEYFGVYTASVALGFGLGPIASGLLLSGSPLLAGVKSITLFYAFVSVIPFLVATLFLGETVEGGESGIDGIKDLIKKDRLMIKGLLDYSKLGYAGLTLLFMTLIFSFYDGMVWMLEPLYYAKLDSNPLYGGLLMASFMLPFVLFSVPGGWLADRIGRGRVLALGLLLAGSCSILFGYSVNPLTSIMYALLATTGLAMAWPSVEGLLTDLVDKRMRGEAVGVWDASSSLGHFLGPLLGGLTAKVAGMESVFIYSGVILLLAVLPVLSLKRK